MTQLKASINRHPKGISILEILLALAIVAAVAIYLTNMVNFVESGNKVDQSFDRMKVITLQIKAYYLSHETLPVPSVTPINSVPVDNQQLNLSQKHRLDAWGQYFRYFQALTIVGFQVNGRNVAGVLISLGPNQTQDYDDTVPNAYTGGGDDLLVPITVEKEAWQIVMAELEILDKRVMAYDRVFAGIDNGGDDIYVAPTANMPDPSYSYGGAPPDESFFLVDEDGCVAATGGGGGVGCLPTGTGMTNDPNCGRATIDNCSTALDNILDLYGLTEPGYRTDPWGRFYQWGNGTTLLPSDRRYHLYYSMGPDGMAGTDDDITPY